MSYILDPSAELDFAVDWTDWLQDGETISDASWTVPAGLSEVDGHDSSVVDGLCTIWLTGGTPGCSYTVTCHITTSMGRQDDRSLTIESRER